MTEERTNATAPNLGVYVSVPFCRAKCSFCNFASGVATSDRIAAYIETLCAEIDAARETAQRLGADVPQVVDTVYFGGGTPSLLSPEQLRRIFAALRQNFDVCQNAEITLESAPGQVADDVLDAAQLLGVNRVSLGVQSFVDRESAAVGRTHTGESCLREIAHLRAAGVAELGADLIAGLPYQTAETWQYSLETAIGAGLTHLSVYMLEVDEESRLGREVMAGGARFHAHSVPQDDVSAELFEQASAFLETHGFQQYEISNFALHGADASKHQSRHNRKYWERAPYLGFGLDAHSMLETGKGAVRFANPADLPDYDSAAWGGNLVHIGDEEAFEESIFLGLRMNHGVSIATLRMKFGQERLDACEQSAREMLEAGLMDTCDGRWRLTLRGRLVSSEVFGRLLVGAPVVEV